MLLDDGVLVQKDGGWVATVDLSTVPVPPAISALLAARLDRLSSDERAVLEAASIVGEVFERSSVAAIAAEISDDEIGRHLTSLLRKDLIRPSASDIGAEEAFRFRHILLRDAAYEQIPKDDRASMHVSFADHLTGTAGERVHEFDEFLGFHLARATELWTELDVADERVAAARERAFEHLRTAGTRAFGRADLGAAATLLSRAQSLVDPDDPRRLALVYELGQSLIETGALQEAEDTMRDLAERAGRANDLTAELQAETLGAAARFFRGSKTAIPELGELSDRLIEHCERVGDVRGSAIAWSHRAQHRWLVDLAAAEDAAERARAYARDAGDRYLQNEMRLLALASRGWGPAKVDEALAAAREAVADARRDGDRHVEGSALFGLAHMSAYLGDFDEARLCLEAGRELSLDLGLELERFATAQGAGQLEELAGDLDAAAAYLLESCEGLQQLGETAFLSTSAAKLADVEARRGNLAEAERWIEVADRTGAPEDQATRVYLALARGRLEGARGSDDMAEEHLRRAIDIAEESDAYPPRVETRIALAELLARRGRPEEARAVSDDAVAIARAKGSVSHERLARAVLDV
jgi:tetratricopeptide (TPR) repeat protein